MAVLLKKLKICPKGHKYYKSTYCPTCLICEAARKPASGFISTLSAPAQRTMANNKIKTLKQLTWFSEKEILEFHRMGPGSIAKLKRVLQEEGLSFKK